MVGRYSHAHQFKRARRELKFLRTRLGRIIHDIRRKMGAASCSKTALARYSISHRVCAIKSSVSVDPRSTRCTRPRWSASRQNQGRAPYEFGCKVSITTPVTAPRGGQFVLHAKALHIGLCNRPPSRSRHRRPRKTHRCCGAPHPRRQRLSRPQLSRPFRVCGSPINSVVSPKLSVARCGVAPPSSR